MFTSAKPSGPWCGAVRRHASAKASSPTQRLADAGAPPPRASRDDTTLPARGGAVAASSADARKLMLHTGEKRQPAAVYTTGAAALERSGTAAAAAETVVVHSDTAAAAAEANTAQKRSRSMGLGPGSDGTGTKKMAASQLKRSWAKLHRTSKLRYGKRRTDLPLVCKSALRGRGLDDPHLDTKAVEELKKGAYTLRQRRSRRKQESHGGRPGPRGAA